MHMLAWYSVSGVFPRSVGRRSRGGGKSWLRNVSTEDAFCCIVASTSVAALCDGVAPRVGLDSIGGVVDASSCLESDCTVLRP